MIVTIPKFSEHAGYAGNLISLEISDFCPICGKPRGKIYGTHSYDGSLRLNVDGWINDCGHVDKYSDIVKDGKVVPFKEPEPFSR